MKFICCDHKDWTNFRGKLHNKSPDKLVRALELELLSVEPDIGIDPLVLEFYLDAIEMNSPEEIPAFDVQASLSRFKAKHILPSFFIIT